MFSVYAANCICGWGAIFESKDEFDGICLDLWTEYAARTPANEISPEAFRALAYKEHAKREHWPEIVYEDILDADELTDLPEKQTPSAWAEKYRTTNPSNP